MPTKKTFWLTAKILSFCILYIALTYTVNSYVIANRGENSSGDSKERTINTANYIVDGAANYLNAYSTYLALLNRIELSKANGIDYDEMTKLIDMAIAAMERTEGAYTSLVFTSLGNVSDYNFAYRLSVFDYAKYAKTKGLNSVIFNEVTRYLKSGDVVGVFIKLWVDSGRIKAKLNDIKSYISTRTFPNLSLLWALNQEFSQTMLFGQYAAQVFFAVDGEYI